MTEQTSDCFDVTVVIPTYNRKNSLLRTLESLSRQTYPTQCFEAIVIDDGSNDGTEAVAQGDFSYKLRYLRQTNRGDAHARNWGAQEAQGVILQFIDDDIVLGSTFLRAVVAQHSRWDKLMVIGNLLPLPSLSPTPFERIAIASQNAGSSTNIELDFTEILSGILSMKREHYLALGMMQPIAKSGSSVWCDVEFSYRACRQGFRLWRAIDAVAYHDDYALRDFGSACQRARRVATVGAGLFQRHPALKAHIPMFRDKDPIEWRHDAPALVMRKLARQVASSRSAMWTMEHAIPPLERHVPESKPLELLYRWVVSGHIYQGYREGLHELKSRARSYPSDLQPS